MSFIAGLLKNIYKEKNVIFALAKDDFKLRFAGAGLGAVWGFISPFVSILLYWFVFQVGLKNGSISNGMPYVLWLVAGIVPWFYFSESWTTTTNCMYEYGFIVKKVLFKVELLPVVKILSTLIVHVFLIDLCFLLFATYGYKVNIYNLQIVYYVVCEIALVYALSLITSSISVFIKDTLLFIGIITQILFWTIPIVWSPELLEGTLVLRLLKLNPVYYLVNGFRDAMIERVWFWDRPAATLYFWAVTVVLFMIGINIYEKTNKYFADLL